MTDVLVTDELLAHRRLVGIHRLDERWDGEWHLVNAPKYWHGQLQARLVYELMTRGEPLGLIVTVGTAVFGGPRNWRTPDVVVARPGSTYGDDEGLARAELVIEIRSPGDESYEKLPFYGERCREVMILRRDRTFDLHRATPEGLVLVPPDADGAVHCEALDVTFTTVAGPGLRIAWEGHTADI